MSIGVERYLARPLVCLAAALVASTAAACGGGDQNRSETPRTPGPAVRADDGARIVTVQRLGNRILDLRVDSPAVGRTVPVRLFLPRGFHGARGRRWPLLYLLHGCCDSYRSWTRSTDVEQLTATSQVLVAMPDGGRVGFYSNWLHGPAWETFHLVELRELLERAYRAGRRRAIAGVSMGGLGAMAYAARHPRMFRAAAAYSGLLDTHANGGAHSRRILALIASEGGDPRALWGDPVREADRWASHNPYDRASGLRGTRLFVSAGTGEPGPLDPSGADDDPIERFAHDETTAFAEHLSRLGIAATVDLYGQGTHTWPYWQRELHRSWPLLSGSLSTGAPLD